VGAYNFRLNSVTFINDFSKFFSMVFELEHLIAVGCSAFGPDAISYMVPRLDLSRAGVVLLSHIETRYIYDFLKSKKINVAYPRKNMDIRPGQVFLNDEFSPHARFKTKRGPLVTGSIDIGMDNLSHMYGDKCIGVILSGSGADGVKGVKAIQDRGGKILVQVEELVETYRTKRREGPNYPGFYAPLMPDAVLRRVKPYFAGPIDELTIALNGLIADKTQKAAS
jgi:chemotaxis response regulator CheB